jgi:hypothetical protein
MLGDMHCQPVDAAFAFAHTVTVASAGIRARAMTELCYQWGGVASVATYVPLLNGALVAEEGAPADWTVPDVIRHLSAFHKQMETEGAGVAGMLQ